MPQRESDMNGGLVGFHERIGRNEEKLDSVSERLSKLEGKVENNSSRIVNQAIRIEKLEGNNDALIRLSTLMEVQTEMDKQQNEQMSEFGKILNSVNTNLSHLNSSHEQLKADMDDIGKKVQHMEKDRDDNKIDPVKLVRNIIIGVIMLSVTLIGSFLTAKLGLK